MNTQQAIEFFGNKAQIGKALGLTRAAVSHWGEYPPQLAQYRLEEITGGKLKRTPLPKKPK